jgi:hypothetical protein
MIRDGNLSLKIQKLNLFRFKNFNLQPSFKSRFFDYPYHIAESPFQQNEIQL